MDHPDTEQMLVERLAMVLLDFRWGHYLELELVVAVVKTLVETQSETLMEPD
jgi:hypothetical protein